MGLYERYALPRLIDWGMRAKVATAQRARFVPRARGRVLEIGLGSGLNLPYYGADVERLFAVDPSAQLRAMAERRARAVSFPVDFIGLDGAAVPLDNGAVDTVVSTWTLCTIADPVAALAEIRRVLKPDGRLIFVEHGRAPEPRTAAWQDRLTPIQRRLAGGCHLNRRIDELLDAAGFRTDAMERGYLRGPRPFMYHYMGCARP